MAHSNKLGVKLPETPKVVGVSFDADALTREAVSGAVIAEVLNHLPGDTVELHFAFSRGGKTHFTAVYVKAIRELAVNALRPLADDVAAKVFSAPCEKQSNA